MVFLLKGEEDEADADEIKCVICLLPEQEGVSWFGCDMCPAWFHAECLDRYLHNLRISRIKHFFVNVKIFSKFVSTLQPTCSTENIF